MQPGQNYKTKSTESNTVHVCRKVRTLTDDGSFYDVLNVFLKKFTFLTFINVSLFSLQRFNLWFYRQNCLAGRRRLVAQPGGVTLIFALRLALSSYKLYNGNGGLMYR